MHGIRIRPFKGSDVQSIIEIFQNAYASAYRVRCNLLKLDKKESNRYQHVEMLRYMIRLKFGKYLFRVRKAIFEVSLKFLLTDAFDPVILVAEKDKRIVGVINIIRINEWVWELQDIAVHLDFQSRGIGTKLMEEAIYYVKSKGGLRIYLGVRANNFSAIRLYKKFGFNIHDEGYTMKLDLEK